MPRRNQSSFSGCWVIGADFPAASPSPDITAAAPGGRRGHPGLLGGTRGCSGGPGLGSAAAPGALSAGIPIGMRSPGWGNVLPVSQAVMAFPAVFTGGSDWARGEPDPEPALRESLT